MDLNCNFAKSQIPLGPIPPQCPRANRIRTDRSRPVLCPNHLHPPGKPPSIKCLNPPHHFTGRTGRDLSLRILFPRANHHPSQKKIPRRKPRDFMANRISLLTLKLNPDLVVHSTHTTRHSAWHWSWIVFFFFSKDTLSS